MSWPNRITVLRLILVTPFILLLVNAAVHPAYRYGAMGVAVVIGILDAADGFIARRTGTVTKIGSVLDPLADKALTISALVAMSFPGILSKDPTLRLPYWVSVTLVSRELFMLVGAVIVYLLAGFFQGLPSVCGKAATVMQFLTIVLTCASPDLLAWQPHATRIVLNSIWGVTVGLALLAWLGYIRTGSKLLSAGAADR